MNNFEFQNPTRIVFGKGTIKELARLIDKNHKVLIVYGGGSIKSNGVYDQVVDALKDHQVMEFSGIEANPQYNTCMRAVKLIKENNIDFILSVGGGSVLDAVKFIAAAVKFKGAEPWDILASGAAITESMPKGCVLTLPATGSEMNMNAVISRDDIGEKLAFGNPLNYPVFSILDPETTFSLPVRQISNGVVDAFVHVIEQYMTFPANAPIQDRFAEGIIMTLIEEGPKALANPQDYDVRANIMWAATMALNHLIGTGVPQDWSTHTIGHELTALHGIDHARTLAIILPAMWKHQRSQKGAKLAQFARRVWGVQTDDQDKAIDAAIEKTVDFFRQMQVPVCLKDIDLTPQDCQTMVDQLAKRNSRLGEHGDITSAEIAKILELAA